MNGILNINKATGMTSHDVVATIRRLLKEKRVGHAGTLDPAASGVLPICVGQATRVAEYLSDSGKAYLATILFGTVTDTYDAEGTILRTSNTDALTLQSVEEALKHFLGPQVQVPPRYSAIKLYGQPAYKRTRSGEDIELPPRPIVIYSLQVSGWNPPFVTLAIECGKGTYIRSLAYDLGEYLGCGASLHSLVRTRSGPFLLSESITLDQLAGALTAQTPQGGDGLSQFLYPADKALEHYPALRVNAATVERVLHGNAFNHPYGMNMTQAGNVARVYSDTGHFIAIAVWDTEQEVWKPRKVFMMGGTSGNDGGA